MKYRIERWDRPKPPDAGELIEKMNTEGYGVFQWSDGPGTVYADHEHGEDQSHWVIGEEPVIYLIGAKK